MGFASGEERAEWYRKHPVYIQWNSMRANCGLTRGRSPKAENVYAGISVCQEWRSYANYEEWALRNGWRKGLVIARVDKTKDFSPENCVVVNRREAVRLNRNILRVDGVPFAELIGDYTALEYSRKRARYAKLGWDLKSSLSDCVIANGLGTRRSFIRRNQHDTPVLTHDQ